MTRSNPEIDWKMSIWPISSNSLSKYAKIENFQYKLKTNALISPADYYYSANNEEQQQQIQPITPHCLVCKKEDEEATIQHIFSNCTIAHSQNYTTYQTLQNNMELQDSLAAGTWFSLDEGAQKPKYTKSMWNIEQGDLGYLPRQIMQKLNKKSQNELAKIIATSRYEIWIQYWKSYLELHKNSQKTLNQQQNKTKTNKPQANGRQNINTNNNTTTKAAPNANPVQMQDGTASTKATPKQKTLHHFFRKTPK